MPKNKPATISKPKEPLIIKSKNLQTTPNPASTQTNENRAGLIWDIANHLVGLYKPHEYGKVILPFTVIKRFNDTLLPTRKKVLDAYEKHKKMEVKDVFLTKASGYNFYNTSPFSFVDLINDSENIEANLRSYINGFSKNISDVIWEYFELDKQIDKLAKGDALFIVIQEFCGQNADLSPSKISSAEMGYIFEHLIKKFSESYNEEAGAHFTARDIVYLMTDLLISGDEEDLKDENITKEVYDMAMGTSQMLGCLSERVAVINPKAKINCYGQENNPETFAIAKSDMLIRGGDANNMRYGDTLDNDQFQGFTFDYIISNPPFGIDWKKQADKVRTENASGENGRFGAGLPNIDDSQMLFMLNGIAKLKEKGRMAIIQNGSPLQGGDAGSGQSEIRRCLIENDWLEAIVQMPNELFYNTGITTYIWLVSKNKNRKRAGKVQLINAKDMFEKRRRSLGKKRNDFTDDCIRNIIKVYQDFKTKEYTLSGKPIESKIIKNADFKFFKVVVETPLFDNKSKPIKDKKGNPTPDKDKRDTESIPANITFSDFMAKNVLPYNQYAYIDESKTKVGYEIPFTKLFYKYQPPRDIDDIFNSIKELEKKETALMKELFGENGNNSIAELVLYKKSITDNTIKSNYQNWARIRFVQVFELGKGLNITKADLQDEGIPVVNYGEIHSKYGRILNPDIHPLKYVKKDYLETDEKSLLKYGDFVFADTSEDLEGSGNFTFLDSQIPVFAGYHTIVARPKIEVDSLFLSFLCDSYLFREQVQSQVAGIKVFSITKGLLKNVYLWLPSLSEQKTISSYLNKKIKSVDNLISVKEQIISALKDCKESLVQEAFTGKKEPPEDVT